MIYMGIDPGMGGGIARLDDVGYLSAIKMPITEIEIYTALAPVDGVKVRCVLEGVGPSPQMGVRSAWTFGKGYGGLIMALTSHAIPFEIVYPVKWQNALGCRTGGDKNISRAKAQSLFPTIKCTHAISDALLLAEYCRKHLPR